MSAERWMRVKQITSEALERPDSDRLPWLAETCAGDEQLRREVESLLTAHARAGSFLESPAMAGGGAEAIVAATRYVVLFAPSGATLADAVGEGTIVNDDHRSDPIASARRDERSITIHGRF